MVDADTAGPVTFKAAQWTTELRFEDIPDDVVNYTKLSILDGIGCAIRGQTMEAGQRIMSFADAMDEDAADATIWGKNKKTGARLAALVNGTTAHVPNIGVSYNTHPIHINYLIPQAAIAAAEKTGAGGREVITAFVAGTELITRACVATHLSEEGGYFNAQSRGWQTTGAVGGIGTSAAAGKIFGLSLDQMVQAIVLGGTQLTGVYRPSGPYMGKSLFAGKAAAAGIENAEIARTGFVAGYKLYEDGLCFGSGILSPVHDLDAAVDGLGERWESLNVDFCIHPAKKTYNANIDALLDVLNSENLKFNDIERINILSAYTKAHAHDNFRPPTNSTEAFNSVQYIVAATAYDGEYGFVQLEKDKYENKDIISFAKNKVFLVPDAELELLVKTSWPGGIEIVTKDGRTLTKKFKAHRGEIHNPLSTEELQDKLRRMTEGYDQTKVDSIIEVMEKFENIKDIRKLTSLL